MNMCFRNSINLMLSDLNRITPPHSVFMKSWPIVDRSALTAHAHNGITELKRHMHGLTNEMITCRSPKHVMQAQKCANSLAEFQFDWQTAATRTRANIGSQSARDDDVFILMNINADESLMLRRCRCVNYVLCSHQRTRLDATIKNECTSARRINSHGAAMWNHAAFIQTHSLPSLHMHTHRWGELFYANIHSQGLIKVHAH